MKKFDCSGLEKSDKRRNSTLVMPLLVIAAAITIANQSFGDETHYRVILEDVPGVDEIETGNIVAGIKILKDQLNHVEQANSGKIWSTLCAAYIINNALNEAERACMKAVDIDSSYYALNNRGVYHVYTGDLIRARQDFDRVRPVDMDAYLYELKTTNIRLVAAGNFDLVNQLSAMRARDGVKVSSKISSADIEELNDC